MTRSGTLWCAAAIVWGVAAAGVWAWTTRYEFTTYGAVGDNAAAEWPNDTRLSLADDRPTLLYFLHPRCPCTRASIREMDRVLTGAGLSESQHPRFITVVTLPSDASDEWRETDTVRSASSLPRAELAWDIDGVEASRFGAMTSGAVRLYRPDGTLLFAGGVTASRGHEGDNLGAARLQALLSGRTRDRQDPTPVFGCRLCVAEGESGGVGSARP